MARIPEVTDRTSLPAEHQPIFDAIAESRGRVGAPFSLLLHSPEAASRIAHLGTYLRFESPFAAADRELAILVAARESDCSFEFAAHSRLGRQTGVREEAIEAVRHRSSLEAFTPAEALIVDFGRQLLREHRVAPDTFDAAQQRFGEAGVVDLVALMGYYTMLACALNTFEVSAPDGEVALA